MARQIKTLPKRTPPNVKVVDKTIMVPKGKPSGIKGALGPAKLVLRKTREAQDRIASESKKLPLDVMVENMLFYHGQAIILSKKIDKLLANQKTEDQDGWSVQDMFSKMMHFRDEAQGCAVDAAPYLHPKLASVQYRGGIDIDQKKTIEVIRRVIVDPGHQDAEGLPATIEGQAL